MQENYKALPPPTVSATSGSYESSDYLSATKDDFFYYKARYSLSESVSMQSYKDAFLNAGGEDKSEMALFDESDRMVPGTEYPWIQQQPQAPGRKDCNVISDMVIYGGYWYSQFGHRLIDSLSRVWPFLDEAYREMKFVFHTKDYPTRAPDISFLRLLGMKSEQIVFLDKDTLFKNILVPTQVGPPSVLRKALSRKCTDVINVIASNIPDFPDSNFQKVYLSRMKFTGKDVVLGEKNVENLFMENGFKIIYPETLPLEKQIAIMKNCRVLAGINGSALHLSLFMPDGGDVIVLNRTTSMSAYGQIGIGMLKRFRTYYIDASIALYPDVHALHDVTMIGMTGDFRKFCREYGLKVPYHYVDEDFKKDFAKYLEHLLSFRA